MAKAATSGAEAPRRTRRTRKTTVEPQAVIEATVEPVVEVGSTKRRAMSNEHKSALAAGRSEGRGVRAYLKALEKNRPKRGRKRTEGSVEKQLQKVEAELVDAAPMQRLLLLQRRITLQQELERLRSPGGDLAELQAEFVRVARSFGQRKGIGYATWREAGVPTSVLKEAGIARSV